MNLLLIDVSEAMTFSRVFAWSIVPIVGLVFALALVLALKTLIVRMYPVNDEDEE